MSIYFLMSVNLESTGVPCQHQKKKGQVGHQFFDKSEVAQELSAPKPKEENEWTQNEGM